MDGPHFGLAACLTACSVEGDQPAIIPRNIHSGPFCALPAEADGTRGQNHSEQFQECTIISTKLSWFAS